MQKQFYPTLELAKQGALSHNFTSSIDYHCRRPLCDSALPSNPQKFYRNQWVSWYDFLGTQPNTSKLYQSFEVAKTMAKSFKFKSIKDYKLTCKMKDKALSISPNEKFKVNWRSWDDYLGLNECVIYKEYNEAQNSAKNLKIKSSIEYAVVRKSFDLRLPSSPELAYKNQWINWYQFLGTQDPAINLYANYLSAKLAAKKYKFTSATDYAMRYKALDNKLPSTPKRKYRHDWVSWQDFLNIN
ncbi:hypothetical protein CJF42_00435 [Pseudoalteromonas sp. NBT06-2]|uniref:integrase repeat-containing protein n=1 Tax=Pseudoalteromonas sp. NBT06-2 TaxID=2025950 RepID=UPI000BA6F2C8|nr:integrase repeat-containing protein [Pseudoalteromonas sp. NBT06-2]PAJ76399.1 hypothetical protein CJF42_00435 [Pseudoalteromonas sp. NBT06-2]